MEVFWEFVRNQLTTVVQTAIKLRIFQSALSIFTAVKKQLYENKFIKVGVDMSKYPLILDTLETYPFLKLYLNPTYYESLEGQIFHCYVEYFNYIVINRK